MPIKINSPSKKTYSYFRKEYKKEVVIMEINAKVEKSIQERCSPVMDSVWRHCLDRKQDLFKMLTRSFYMQGILDAMTSFNSGWIKPTPEGESPEYYI